MANETTKVVLDLDNAEFVSKMRETMGLMDEFGRAESLANLAAKLGELGAIAAVLYVSFQALKTAIDFVEQAEQIKQVNAAFEAMSESAGLAADVLKNQLLKAVDGLASDTDVLQAANKALASMGDNAAKLPQIMEIARKATALFGGDLLGNFENINAALAAGNVRMLRHYGIIVDVDAATKKYANSLGIGTEYLNQAGRRQAVFNEALEQAGNKFKDVDVNLTQTANSFQRLWSGVKEVGEAIAIMWESFAGPTVRTFVSAIAHDMHMIAASMKVASSHGEEQADAKKKLLEDQVSSLKQILETTNKVTDPGLYERYAGMLSKAENQLQRINDQEERALQLKMKQEGASGKQAKDKTPVAASKEDLDKIIEARRKFENDILTLRKERQKAEEGIETDDFDLTILHTQEELRIEDAAEQKKVEIKKLYDGDAKTKGIINAQQYANAVEEIEKKKVADLKVINQKYDEDRLQALKNLQKQNQYTAQGFATGWQKSAAQATLDNKNFGAMGEKTFSAVSKNAANAFKAMGDGSKTAGEAMKGFMFGALGDIATAKGEVMLADGIGSFNPIQIAEGGVLLALGSMLSSMGTSTGSSVSAGGGGGSSGGSASAASTGDTATAQSLTPAAAAQKKTVTVQIMGHYFETEQTRTKMMDLIRQSGDFTDFNLKQIGQP